MFQKGGRHGHIYIYIYLHIDKMYVNLFVYNWKTYVYTVYVSNIFTYKLSARCGVTNHQVPNGISTLLRPVSFWTLHQEVPKNSASRAKDWHMTQMASQKTPRKVVCLSSEGGSKTKKKQHILAKTTRSQEPLFGPKPFSSQDMLDPFLFRVMLGFI